MKYHFGCHDPPILSVPSIKWKCNECQSLPEEHRRKLGNPRYYLRERCTFRQNDEPSSSVGNGDEHAKSKAVCARKEEDSHQNEEEVFDSTNSDKCCELATLTYPLRPLLHSLTLYLLGRHMQ